MKVTFLLALLVLILLGISGVLFLMAGILSQIGKVKCHRKGSPPLQKNIRKHNIGARLLAEYYGGLKSVPNGEAKAIFEKGLFLKQRGALRQAIEVFGKCLDQDLTVKQKTGVLITKGNCYFTLNELDLAQECYERANHLSNESGNDNGRLSSLINLGLVYAIDGKLDQAISNYYEVVKLDRKLMYIRGEATDLNTLGLLCERKGDLEKALACYTASLLILEKLNDQKKVELVENNISRVKNLREGSI